MIGSINQVGKIEILRIVSSNDIWIDISDKLTPSNEHISFSFETENMGSHNLRTRIKGEYIPHKWLALSMNFDYVCNLDYWILIWRREFALARLTLYIK